MALLSLFQKMVHYFDVQVASKYGVDCAIIIANFQHWIARNAANNINYHDGRHWTFNSQKALMQIFPYWSEGQIKRSLSKLVELGVLMVGNYNKNPFDKTNWYAFTGQLQWVESGTNTPISNSRKRPTQTIDESGFAVAENLQSLDDFGYSITDNKQKIINKQIVNEKKINKDAAEKISTAPPLFFQEEFQDSSEQTIPPDSAAPPLSEKEPTLYTRMLNVYFDWHQLPDVAGVKPNMNAAEGANLKKLTEYLRQQAISKAEERGIESPDIDTGTVTAFQYVLEGIRTGKVSNYHRQRLKIGQIFSEITNIISQIKNGHGKQANTENKYDRYRDVSPGGF